MCVMDWNGLAQDRDKTGQVDGVGTELVRWLVWGQNWSGGWYGDRTGQVVGMGTKLFRWMMWGQNWSGG
jgi:hypothetical protein